MSNIFLFISGSEIFIVLLVVLILFGANKIPEIARTLGKGLREVHKATDEIKKEIRNSEIKKDLDDIKKNIDESDIKKNIDDIKDEIKKKKY